MRLKNFTPSGNQVLAKVKFYNSTESGIIVTTNPEKDMFAEVVAVGPLVKGTKVGDYVMFGDVAVIHLPFETSKKEEITCVLTSEFSILGYYAPDKDEDRIFVPVNPARNSNNSMSLEDSEEPYLN